MAFAQTGFSENLKNVYQELWEMRLESSKFYLKNEKNASSSQIYLENLAQVFEILATGDPKLYATYQENEDQRLKKIKKMDKNNPYFLLSQAEILVQGAFVHLLFAEQYQAANHLRKSYDLLEKNIKLYPDFAENQKIFAGLQIMLQAVPSQYHWLIGLFGLKGNYEKAWENLEKISESQSLYALETQLFSVLLQLYVLQNPQKAVDICEKYLKNSDNRLANFVKALVNFKNLEFEKALFFLNKIEENSSYQSFFYVNYLKAECHLLSENYLAAIKEYAIFLENYAGNPYKKDAVYKTFLAYIMLGDSKNSLIYLQKIQKTGAELSIPDRYAEKFANYKPLPHFILMKVRLLTDGGKFAKAIHFLDQYSEKDFDLLRDKIEFHYRKARAFHEGGQVEKAIDFYEKTIALNQKKAYYFAANSCLQLGKIYEKIDLKKAINYYEKVLEYDDHEYKNTLDGQTKMALKRLEK